MTRGILLGALLVLLLEALGAYFFVKLGLMPANADADPPRLERWAAKTSLRATIRREMKDTPPPVPADEANLLAGIKLYERNCAVCHGAADGKASNVAVGLYQRGPQLAKHGVEDDPEGETYWKVYHGIRLTGMPSYRKTLSETELWQVTLFLKNMDALPPKAAAAWKKVPSQAPAAGK